MSRGWRRALGPALALALLASTAAVGTAKVLDGGFGRDTITGTARADDLSGGSGGDRLRGRDGGDRLDGGSGDDVAVRVGLSLSVDCGPGNDVVIILGAAQAGPLPFTGFQDFLHCERMEGVTGPAQIAKLGAVVDDATNRGRRAGDETAVAAASPLTLAARYDRIEGSPIADVITTRPGDGFAYPLGFSRDGAGNVFQFGQRPPPDGTATNRDLVFGKSGDDVIHSGPDNDHLEGEKGDDTLHRRGWQRRPLRPHRRGPVVRRPGREPARGRSRGRSARRRPGRRRARRRHRRRPR